MTQPQPSVSTHQETLRCVVFALSSPR